MTHINQKLPELRDAKSAFVRASNPHKFAIGDMVTLEHDPDMGGIITAIVRGSATIEGVRFPVSLKALRRKELDP